ncbi:MAG: hypothetical protein IJQ89_03760 [Bacteroidales bacterium]|nr:hypothetical protein [Bacteroidales bacterium]
MPYKTIIEKICLAALDKKQHLLNHYNRTNINDHSNIESFQKGIRDYLNQTFSCLTPKYKWETEVKPKGRNEKDSIDIKGNSINKSDINCIIEIDACRQDQVASKFLSRLSLWGTKEPILYVALLYKKYSKKPVEKYVRYANSIIKLINKNSAAIGIYVNVNGTSNDNAEIWDFNKNTPYKRKFRINNNDYDSMVDCASAAINLYVNNNKSKTYNQLKKVFDKYVDDKSGPSRYKRLNKKSKDGIDLYSYTQFREHGQHSTDWDTFVGICHKAGIFIERIWVSIK